MNIQTQVAGILVLLVLAFFYVFSKKPNDKSMGFFKKMLAVSSMNIFFDIYSVVVLATMENFGIYERTICKLYLMSMAYLAYISFRYLMEDVSIRSLVYIKNVASAVLGLSWVIIAISPIEFMRDSQGVATFGPAVLTVYMTATVFLISDFVIIFTFKKKMNPTRWKAVFVWLAVWIASTAIQFVNNKLLLVSFAGTLGLVIVYTKLENPDYYTDNNIGLLNEAALKSSIEIRLAEKRDFSLMAIKIVLADNRDVLSDGNSHERIVNQVARTIEKAEGVIDCYVVTGRQFYMLFDSPDVMSNASVMLEAIFDEICVQNQAFEQPRIIRCEIPYAGRSQNYDVLSDQIRYFMANETPIDSNHLIMDDKWIESHTKKIETIQMIDKAIQEDRIVPFFQPIYSIEKDRFVSAEALARIIDEEGKIIPPGVFIPVAEETRQIEKIGQIIFEKVCKFIVDNDIKKYGIDYIEVNLSVVQCAREYLADTYIDIMKKIGVAPSMINLEITESSAVNAKARLIKNMDKLIAEGCSFSLDDFGTGYSNLEYVHELPVHIIKFDRTMVLSYFNSDKGRIIMDAVMYMCKELGLKIVAEGIEEKEQLDALIKAKVDYIQGFYFSKPVSGEEFLNLIA